MKVDTLQENMAEDLQCPSVSCDLFANAPHSFSEVLSLLHSSLYDLLEKIDHLGLVGGWMGLRASLNAVEKRKILHCSITISTELS
jgi:hypothetical protein